MTPAEEFQALDASVYHWSAYQPELKCDCGTTAFRAASGFAIVDPIPLAESALEELFALAPLRAVLLTNGNHAREASALREKYGVPLVASPAAGKDLGGIRPDVVLLENELLYGIVAIPVPGATVGETAFFFREAAALAIGDAVINVDPEKGLEFLPDKYCDDPAQNRVSLRKLLELDFRTITFAHGLPVTAHARQKWAALLA